MSDSYVRFWDSYHWSSGENGHFCWAAMMESHRSRCPAFTVFSLSFALKSIRVTRLSLSLSPVPSFDTCVCVLGIYPLKCATHTHMTHTHTQKRHSHMLRRTGWNTHPYTKTPTLCSAGNTKIVFWLHFLQGGDKHFSSHMVEMKSNYICDGSPTFLLLWRSQLAWVTTVGPKCVQ